MAFRNQSKYRTLAVPPGTEASAWGSFSGQTPSVAGGKCSRRIAASASLLAFADKSGSGKDVSVLSLADAGQKHKEKSLLRGHSALVTDLDFSRFDDDLLATCSS